MTLHPDARIVLRASGVCLILDATGGRLPAVLYWGRDIGSPTAADLDAFAAAGEAPVAPNGVDEPVRLSILPEHWTGWTGRPGLTGSRAGRAWSPRFSTTHIDVDAPGQNAEERPGAGPELILIDGPARVVFSAEDTVAALELELEVELDASGIVRLRGTVRNTGADEYQVDELLLALPIPQTAAERLDFAGRWGMERVPQRGPIALGSHRREGRHGRTGADSAYILHAGAPGFNFAGGEIWALHTGWSGNHVHQVERLPTGEQTLAGGELLLPGEVRLASGASYRSPWVYGAHGVGLDAIARRFHALLRARPQHPRSPRPVTLNVWEAVYFDHDLDTLLELADRAASLGVERFVLDDGWFGSRRDDRSGLGDWVVSNEAWPFGLHPLVDRVSELGMQFGLWFEPEMVNPDSRIAREHPEWIMSTGGRLPVESRFQQVLNLGITECYEYVRDAMCGILDEYDIAYIKWDHNRDLIDAGSSTDGRPAVHEQTLAFYRLVDELKARYPGLEIESCSSGGARVDLGVLERTDRIWVSDNIDPLDRQRMNRWTTQLVPPEMMGSHIASRLSHTTGRRHDLSFRAATALFGHFGIEWDLREASTGELAELADWIAFYKQHRALLHGGDLVRLDHPDPTVLVHGVVAPDRSEAIFSYAVLARSELVSPGRVPFPGLDPERRYAVEPVLVQYLPPGTRPPAWWNPAPGERAGVTVPGSLLSQAGLMAPLLNPEHAIVYRVTAVD
ncbi:MAG TPA: alpha-galactosidase [Leifsonia sp.]|nr:alpha-galactosidase [Leifsonia sp.]